MLNKGFKTHIVKALEENFRLGKRKKDEYREISIEVGVFPKAEGSARVRFGTTEVLAGVKMEINKPFPDTPEEGGIAVNMELLPLSNPDFESGPPQIEAIEMARVVDRCIRESKAIDFKKLCITPGEAAWFISIDIISFNDNGNLLDASALAAVAAINDTKFPKLVDNKKVDYKSMTTKKLPINGTPVLVTVHKLGEHYFVDPDSDEEDFSDIRLSVASLEKNILCALQKGGDFALTEDDVLNMVDIALRKGEEIRKLLKGAANDKK
jgi:exosome complex component RRP42